MRERIAVALNNKLVGIRRHWLPEVLCRLAFLVKQSPGKEFWGQQIRIPTLAGLRWASCLASLSLRFPHCEMKQRMTLLFFTCSLWRGFKHQVRICKWQLRQCPKKGAEACSGTGIVDRCA